jgi:hypothetical protein
MYWDGVVKSKAIISAKERIISPHRALGVIGSRNFSTLKDMASSLCPGSIVPFKH